MFTRDFRKLRLTVAIFVTAGIVYGMTSLFFQGITRWAEARRDVYPYQAGEDPIRYLLPALMDRPGKRRILLMGPSAAGEALLNERFDEAFPDKEAYNGALSTATLDDCLLTLDYMEKVYGREAMPEILVLGVQLRFVANIPRRFGPVKDRFDFMPLIFSIDHYSTRFKVDRWSSPNGSLLRPKQWHEGAFAFLKFALQKQKPRYQAAVAALLDRALEGIGYSMAPRERFPFMEKMRSPINQKDLPAILSFSREQDVAPALRRWLREFRSPYLTQYLKPMNRDLVLTMLEHPGWNDDHKWNARVDEEMVRFQISDLVNRATRNGIRLYVVNLPENSLSRNLYDEGLYSYYLKILTEALGDTPFLDLREMLRDEDFFDDEHAMLEPARQVTDRVVAFIKEDLERR